MFGCPEIIICWLPEKILSSNAGCSIYWVLVPFEGAWSFCGKIVTVG